MVSLLAPPEDRCPSFPFIVTIEPAPSPPCPCRQGSAAKSALRRNRVFAGGLPIRHGPPIAPLPNRRGARRFDRGQQRGVDFRHHPGISPRPDARHRLHRRLPVLATTHWKSANAQGVSERGKNSKSSSFGPWSNLSGRGEMEMDRIVRHQFRHRAISPVHS